MARNSLVFIDDVSRGLRQQMIDRAIQNEDALNLRIADVVTLVGEFERITGPVLGRSTLSTGAVVQDLSDFNERAAAMIRDLTEDARALIERLKDKICDLQVYRTNLLLATEDMLGQRDAVQLSAEEEEAVKRVAASLSFQSRGDHGDTEADVANRQAGISGHSHDDQAAVGQQMVEAVLEPVAPESRADAA
jgi:hypothetical protein